MTEKKKAGPILSKAGGNAGFGNGNGKGRNAVDGPDDMKEGEFRLIDRWAVTRMMGISLSTMERRQREEVNFPVPYLIGTRNLRWLQHEVEQYILNLPRLDRFG